MDSQLIMRARELAFSYHADQKYGDKPYFDHLKMVANTAILYSELIPREALEDVICAAYLHDILEDTLCTQDEILRALNPRILLIVKLLTKNSSNPEEYFNQVAQDDLAIFVKVCDRFANIACCIRDDNDDKLAKYKEQNPIFYRILLRENYRYLFDQIKEFFELD